MEIAIVVGIYLTLAAQTYRNHLMIAQMKRTQTAQPPVINVTVENPEVEVLPIQTGYVESFQINYDELSRAIKMALIESGVALHNAQLPVVIPVPPTIYPNTPPSPIYYPIISETTTTNELEVDGVKGKQFPAR